MLVETFALLAPRIDATPPLARFGLAVAGELSRPSGLGEGARLILRALEHLQMDAWPIDIGDLLTSPADAPVVPISRPPAGVPLLLHVNPPTLPIALRRLPRRIVRDRKVIGFWNWELPIAPPVWRVGARFVHEVWVASQFTAAAIEPLLPGRVRVVPYPVAVSPPVPSRLDRAAFGLPVDATVILVTLSLASSFERKNPLAAIAAFRTAFGARNDRVLVLKVGNPDHYPDDFARIIAAVGDAPNIRVETRTLPAADLHALTSAADIVLSLHRSEAFGLGLAEAMLLGRPVVATGWSGNLEFMNDRSASLVKFRLVPTQDARGTYHDSEWADPDIADAALRLQHLADCASARRELGASARAAALARLGAEALAGALRNPATGRSEMSA